MSTIQTRYRFQALFNSPMYNNLKSSTKKGKIKESKLDEIRLKRLDFSISEKVLNFVPPLVIYTPRETLVKDRDIQDKEVEKFEEKGIPRDINPAIIPGLMLLDKQFRNPDEFFVQVFLANLGVLLIGKKNVTMDKSNSKFYKDLENFWESYPEIQYIIEKDVLLDDITHRNNFRLLRTNLAKYFRSPRIISAFVDAVVPVGIARNLILNEFKKKLPSVISSNMNRNIPINSLNNYNRINQPRNIRKFSETLPFDKPIETPSVSSLYGTSLKSIRVDPRFNINERDVQEFNQEMEDRRKLNDYIADIQAIFRDKLDDLNSYPPDLFVGILNKFNEIESCKEDIYDIFTMNEKLEKMKECNEKLERFFLNIRSLIKYIQNINNTNDSIFIANVKEKLKEYDFHLEEYSEPYKKKSLKNRKNISFNNEIELSNTLDNYLMNYGLNELIPRQGSKPSSVLRVPFSKSNEEILDIRNMLFFILKKNPSNIETFLNILRQNGIDYFKEYFYDHLEDKDYYEDDDSLTLFYQKKISKKTTKKIKTPKNNSKIKTSKKSITNKSNSNKKKSSLNSSRKKSKEKKKETKKMKSKETKKKKKKETKKRKSKETKKEKKKKSKRIGKESR